MTQPNILFIAPTRIGDAVLSTSILRHIAETQPDARVTIITSPLAAPLFAGFPQLARIIPITKRSYNRHWLAAWRATIGTKWDEVWDMRGSILSFTLRIRRRHYYVPPKDEAPKIKQYEKAFGLTNLPYPTLWPSAEDTATASALLPAGERYFILAPIANWAPKEWPLAHFTALAQSLLTGHLRGVRPVIICAGHEREKALPLLTALAPFNPVDLTRGELPLLSVFACMQRCHGFVGNDSGLMHMAAAAETPTLGLFGPTPHAVYQPWGIKASYLTAPAGDLTQLTVETVASHLREMVS